MELVSETMVIGIELKETVDASVGEMILFKAEFEIEAEAGELESDDVSVDIVAAE